MIIAKPPFAARLPINVDYIKTNDWNVGFPGTFYTYASGSTADYTPEFVICLPDDTIVTLVKNHINTTTTVTYTLYRYDISSTGALTLRDSDTILFPGLVPHPTPAYRYTQPPIHCVRVGNKLVVIAHVPVSWPGSTPAYKQVKHVYSFNPDKTIQKDSTTDPYVSPAEEWEADANSETVQIEKLNDYTYLYVGRDKTTPGLVTYKLVEYSQDGLCTVVGYSDTSHQSILGDVTWSVGDFKVSVGKIANNTYMSSLYTLTSYTKISPTHGVNIRTNTKLILDVSDSSSISYSIKESYIHERYDNTVALEGTKNIVMPLGIDVLTGGAWHYDDSTGKSYWGSPFISETFFTFDGSDFTWIKPLKFAGNLPEQTEDISSSGALLIPAPEYGSSIYFSATLTYGTYNQWQYLHLLDFDIVDFSSEETFGTVNQASGPSGTATSTSAVRVYPTRNVKQITDYTGHAGCGTIDVSEAASKRIIHLTKQSYDPTVGAQDPYYFGFGVLYPRKP